MGVQAFGAEALARAMARMRAWLSRRGVESRSPAGRYSMRSGSNHPKARRRRCRAPMCASRRSPSRGTVGFSRLSVSLVRAASSFMEYVVGGAIEQVALLGEDETAGVPVEPRHVELLLERAHLARHPPIATARAAHPRGGHCQDRRGVRSCRSFTPPPRPAVSRRPDAIHRQGRRCLSCHPPNHRRGSYRKATRHAADIAKTNTSHYRNSPKEFQVGSKLCGLSSCHFR
jgi:hypothetical protein